MTGNSFINHFKTHELSFNTVRFLFFKYFFRWKVFREFGDPAKARFEWRCGIINIISIQAKTHFQSQCIPGTKANWFYSLCFTGFKNGIPYFIGIIIFIFKINFYTAGTGITSCTDQYIFHTGKLSFNKRVVLQVQDIHISK